MYQSKLNVEDNTSTFNQICTCLDFDGNAPGWPDVFGDSLKEYLSKNMTGPIRTLSLFSGAGGLDLGFHDCNFSIVESVEIESKFCKTLEYNSGIGCEFDGSKVNCIDIRDYKPEHLVGKIDFIIGGPPCQTFSAAGRRANGVLGTTDERGVLFREYVRILDTIRPKGFLFENVYGITGAQNGEPWREILGEFSKIGYTLFYRVLDAADYGVPQHRERLIIVGLKEGVYRFPRPTHGPDSLDNTPFYSAGLAIRGLDIKDDEQAFRIKGKYAGLLEGIPPGLNYSFYTEEMGHPTPIFAWRSKFSDFLYKADPETPVRTIKAQGGQCTGPLHWDNRHFTVSEYKRLQTFPDDYVIVGDAATAIHQIGNSVPPQMSRMLALSILIQVFDVQMPFNLSLLNETDSLGFRQRKRQLTELYQKKAKQALCEVEKQQHNSSGKSSYDVDIGSNFAIKYGGQDSIFHVDVDWDKTLFIKITEKSMNTDVPCYKLTITPVKKWNLGLE